MRLLVFRATSYCLRRRAVGAATRAPLVALALAVVAVLLPLLAWRISRQIAVVIAPALADPLAARLLVFGFALPALAGGAVMVVTLTHPSALTLGILAAPAGGLDRLAALLLLPLLTALVGVAPTAAAVLVPLARSSPGGLGSLPAVVAALALAGVTGASLVLGVRAGLRRCRREALMWSIALVFWLGLSCALALETSARALTGAGRLASVVALAVSTIGLGAFAMLLEPLLAEDGQRGSRRKRSVRFPLAPRRAVAVAGGTLLTRRPEVSTAVIGALLVGAAGIALGKLAAAPPPAGALVALTGALVVLAPAGLVVSGVLVDGRSLWVVAPPPRVAVAAVLACVSAIPVAASGLLVVGAAVLARQAVIADVVLLGGLIAGAWIAALATGAIVPWTRAGAGGQSASLGAFAVVGGVAAICATRAAALWSPGGALAVGGWMLIGVLSVVGAVAGLASLAGRSE